MFKSAEVLSYISNISVRALRVTSLKLPFVNSKISFRLAMLVCFMSIIIILGCAMGLFMLTSTEAELNNLFEKRITPIERVLRVQKETLQVRTAILRAILNAQNGESSEADSTAIINIIDEINRQWELANIDESKEEIKKLMATYRDARYQFGADTVYPLIDAINVQDHDQAAMIESISENGYQELESATSNIINYQLISARSEIEDIIKNNNTFKILAIIASSAALIFAVIFSIIIIRGITIPLNRAVNLANHVSKGDLTDTVEARSNDETGQLLTALSSMSEKLRNIVTEIQNDVTVISKGSHDVASSNNNLAESISEQTVSLDLTSSHMNNLVTTNHNAAESASKAHELTEMARREAEQATRVVQDAVNAMNNINESSDRISEITSMIDSIAFQTNLLALNASVEAARAGDQGRGFAVVANEVRNLAQSAAKAAREIRVLIDNSVDSIKSGKELVDKSGKALDNIQNNIENIADIVKTINTASVEQTSGIDEINKAIEEMRAAFKNNSTTVINSAVSSESMAEKVAELMRQISFFNIEKKVDTQSAESTLENKKARLALGKLAPES